MMRTRLTLDVRGRARRLVDERARGRLTRALRRAMRAAEVGAGELALSLTDDQEILALNREYADEDHATDVLSFSQLEGVPTPAAGVLGDVVISVETARRQAVAGGRTLDAELLHLAVHGLVHLLGYDHATPRQESVMFGFEARLRAQASGRRAVEGVERPPLPRGLRVKGDGRRGGR